MRREAQIRTEQRAERALRARKTITVKGVAQLAASDPRDTSQSNPLGLTPAAGWASRGARRCSWVLYGITDSHGDTHKTFSEKVYAACAGRVGKRVLLAIDYKGIARKAEIPKGGRRCGKEAAGTGGLAYGGAEPKRHPGTRSTSSSTGAGAGARAPHAHARRRAASSEKKGGRGCR